MARPFLPFSALNKSAKLVGVFCIGRGLRWSGGAALSSTNWVKPRLKLPRPPRSVDLAREDSNLELVNWNLRVPNAVSPMFTLAPSN